MNADNFWDVIGMYNQQTWKIQLLLMVVIAASFIVSNRTKKHWLPKVALGISTSYIGIVFFLVYGTEPIQHFFAAPLFIVTGLLFIWEGLKNKHEILNPFKRINWFLLFLFLLYPVISMLLGNSFPKMVVYIMPCPVICLSIIIYSRYARKNILILILLSLWGLTGVKSFFFNAYEDIILLLCGLYCVSILIAELKNKSRNIDLQNTVN